MSPEGCFKKSNVPVAGTGEPQGCGTMRWPGGDSPTGHHLAWQNPGSLLASLSSTGKEGKEVKTEFGENQGKTGAERGQRGSPGGGTEAAGPGSPCPPAAPIAPPAALLLKPMLCFIFLPFNRINHKTQLQGKRGTRDSSQPESSLLLAPAGSGEEPEEAKPCQGARAVARRPVRQLADTR